MPANASSRRCGQRVRVRIRAFARCEVYQSIVDRLPAGRTGRARAIESSAARDAQAELLPKPVSPLRPYIVYQDHLCRDLRQGHRAFFCIHRGLNLRGMGLGSMHTQDAPRCQHYDAALVTLLEATGSLPLHRQGMTFPPNCSGLETIRRPPSCHPLRATCRHSLRMPLPRSATLR